MPLPQNNTPWPPKATDEVYNKMAEWAAWYSGEPSRLIDLYAAQPSSSGTVPWWRFWSRARAAQDGAHRAQLHVPVASDLAAVSGSLLFGEAPKIRVRPDEEKVFKEMAAKAEADEAQANIDNPFTETTPDDIAQADAVPKTPTQSPEDKTERRLLEIVERGGVYARLVEAAESAAAIGGVYIYPVWDKDLRDFPLMAIAQADNAIPTFRWGFLTEVIFHRAVAFEGLRIYRHLEHHVVEGTGESKKAVVYHGLYLGTEANIGTAVPLDSHPATQGLEARVELPFGELDVEYVPNIRPNRLWRSSGHGVADIQGSETLLDALDETYASWLRDIRLAKARIIVPREYLRLDENARAAFDIDQEVYVPMDMEPGLSQDARTMLAHQFMIRFEEHRETAKDLIERIVSNAGYTPTTLGATPELNTGTALRVSEHKTLLTLRKKSGWWRAAVANVLHRMLIIDAEIFGSGVEPMRPTVLTSDSIIDNPLELAQTALALKTAESASTETRVRMVHPDWSNAEVEAEVARIEGAAAAAKPAPTVIGRGQFGDPSQDPASTGKLPMTKQPDGPVPPNAPPPNATKKA